MEKGAASQELAKKIARLTEITARARTEETNDDKGSTGKKAKRKKSK